MQPLSAVNSKPTQGGPSFAFGHRAFRGLWLLTWLLFAAWTPPPFNPWRRFLLRLFGAKISCTAKIYPSARIWYPPNLEMHEFSCLGPRVVCYCMATIVMNSYSLASQGAHLCAGGHDIDDKNMQLHTRPITIGSYAWIAAEAFVGPGVHVGDGAVLGARGVTFRNLEPWTVYVGNPVRAMRKRRNFILQTENDFSFK